MCQNLFYLQQIKLTNYKNYDFRAFDFSNKLNFIVGNNGIGKTNLLDAVYYSCFTKSYHTTSDAMVANFNADFFRIETVFMNQINHQILEIKYPKQEKKEVFINKTKIERQADFIGKFPCVIIIPDDNQLILGTSEVRRKFIDATLSQFSSEYLHKLISYNKILVQRNALLKSFFENRTFDKTLLEIYNTQLIDFGNYIFKQRKSFLEKFIPIFNFVYHQIFDGNENITITYDSCLLYTDFEVVLHNNETIDRNAQRTTKGIHTDDLIFELNGLPVKKIGSQGQQKTFLLSLKLAQFELLKQEKQTLPLLLLDDIFDKLDTERIGKLFELINSDEYGQVFITDTNEATILSLIAEKNIEHYKIIQLGKK